MTLAFIVHDITKDCMEFHQNLKSKACEGEIEKRIKP